MPQINRLFAAMATLAILAIISMFAFGYFTNTLEGHFSFSLQSLSVKSLLAVALMMIAFFGRPSSQIRRVVYGTVATIVLGVGAYGAFTSSLLFGDALVLIVGTIIAAIEATADIPVPKSTQSLGSIAVSSNLQQP